MKIKKKTYFRVFWPGGRVGRVSHLGPDRESFESLKVKVLTHFFIEILFLDTQNTFYLILS